MSRQKSRPGQPFCRETQILVLNSACAEIDRRVANELVQPLAPLRLRNRSMLVTNDEVDGCTGRRIKRRNFEYFRKSKPRARIFTIRRNVFSVPVLA